MYGEITQGAKTELAVWDVAHPADLSYWIGRSTLHMRLSNRNYM